MTYVSWASTDSVRRSMLANRQRDTGPELRVRRAVHALGLRYFVDRRPLPEVRRRADLVFPTERIAVFVDGCFWHGCSEHRSRPRLNGPYWAAKVARNGARDADTDARLREAGWTVLRFWEHEDPDHAAIVIRRAVLTVRDGLRRG